MSVHYCLSVLCLWARYLPPPPPFCPADAPGSHRTPGVGGIGERMYAIMVTIVVRHAVLLPFSSRCPAFTCSIGSANLRPRSIGTLRANPALSAITMHVLIIDVCV
jgi:hypothetical protein